ncbi:CHASE domain-containing protein [Mesorhizobium sp. KR9-304]|uniref:CHASE domain-containing protein n=1 Tax=Mesorhizobium sp. KR9-304 TaxID=3156614 RepID=UPI0032B5B45B
MKKHFPIVAFAAVALASLAMAGFAYLAAEEATRIKFEATADDALNRIQSRVDLHLSLLRETDAFFSARAGEVTSNEFKTYFDALQVDKNFGGLQSLGLLGVGKSGDEVLLERAISERQNVERSIFPPSSEGDWRMPVMLIEPLDRGRMTGIGYDMFSDAQARDAILASIETGESRATGRVLLGPQIGAQMSPGFLLFSALERPGAPEGQPAGMLFAAFRTQELANSALDKFPALPVYVQVFDGAAEAENLLFRSQVEPAHDMDFATTRQLLVAGRPWVIEFRPTADFTRPSSPVIPVLLGLFGLLLAVAIALLQRYQARAYEAMSKLQENAENSLLEKDLMLQEMKHRIKNSITRVLAIARQTAASAKDIGEFSESFSARLQAMAASQDMLTRSRWQKADLGELLHIELAQAFGKELPDGMLSGPKVMLTETATQALGLTFHELATNALKYGEAGNSPDALKVDWQVRGQTLLLSWREIGSPVSPPEKPGFGTKLIDMNITRELKGKIRRDYRADGLLIEIEIPLAGKDL